MKQDKFFKFNWKILILTLVIFLIGIASVFYNLGCLLSWSKNNLCVIAQVILAIFAFEIFIGGIAVNRLNLPFNEINIYVIAIHLIYSYLMACLIFLIVNKMKKRKDKLLVKYK